MSGDPRWIGRLDALYGLALCLYPRRFRSQWEAPMRQAFRDRCREIARGQRPPAALLTELLPDFAVGLGRERFHALGEDPMSKRHVLLAMLVLLAATIAMHDRIGIAGNAALDWWKAYRAQATAEAERRYWNDLARALDPAGTPREHTVAAIAWQMAGEGSALLPTDEGARGRAQQAFDAAIAGADPAALWLAATDCPVQRCDERAAIAGLQRTAPDNAAVGILVLAQAAGSGDSAAKAQALRGIAAARTFHSYDADLLASLLRAGAKARAPSNVDADSLVVGVAMAWALPDVIVLDEACRPGAADADTCRAIGRVLADGNSLISRIVGHKLWNRFADPGADRLEVHRRMRNLHWMLANQLLLLDPSARKRWRESLLAGDGEVAALQAGLEARGIPLEAPDTLKLDPKLLSPER